MGATESSAAIPLGPFVLDRVIGSAGMGVVWKGAHVEQGVPVAVKVLTLEGSRDPLYLASLRNEVRGVAALSHPGVVRVYDQGLLPESVSLAAGGEMAPGSPYVVMEWADGGTLLPLCGRMGWSQVWRVLVELLEGLAHAHARGVIHRDIKPSNILLRRTGAGVMLVDFGLARAGDRERGGSAFLDVGTPGYMAPEQIRRRWRDIGPWTDLYAVGGVATALVSARVPFDGLGTEEVLQAHLDQPIPPLDPRCDVPEGFETWVRRMLHKSLHHRYSRAADAIQALMELVDEPDPSTELIFEPLHSKQPEMERGSTDLKPLVELEDPPRMAPADTEVMNRPLHRVAEKRVVPEALPDLSPALALCDRPVRPPVPVDWRSTVSHRKSQRLLGTGLGIFGFRDLPVIGRESIQDHLWEQMLDVTGQLKGRSVVLSGSGGSGRSHLARWLSQRAHELGAASVLRISVPEKAGVSELLAPLVHQILHTWDMERSEARERMAERLAILGSQDEEEIEGLLSLLGPFPGEGGKIGVQFERAKARYVLVRRLLQRRSILRPLILVIDDAHHSENAIAFARHLVRAQEYAPHPILIILTVGAVDPTEETQRLLQEYSRLSRVENITLGPLSPDDREVLVREILGLDRQLAEIVARRSGGNPQFAVQLVGDWVQKGQLEVGEDGFQMRPGITPEIPADLQAMWERRLAAAIPMDREVPALELAAVMGMEVDPLLWGKACASQGISQEWELVEQLMNGQLAMAGDKRGSWRFSHYLVAEALVRRADFGGRLKHHHLAAAEALGSVDIDQVAPQLGRHLLGGGELERAVEVLLKAAVGCIHRSEWNRAWALLAEREDALRKLSVPEWDERWSEGWLCQAKAMGARNDLDLCQRLCQQVLQYVKPDSSMAVLALNGLGRVARIRGHNQQAREFLVRAKELCDGPPGVLVEILIQQGSLESHYGDVDNARRIYEQALQAALEHGDEGIIFDVKFYQAGLYRRMGDEASARAALTEVRDWGMANGRRERVAQCANDLAEMDRIHGDREAATEGYLEALRLYEAVGARQAYVARINLGIMAADGGRTLEAREHLGRAIPMVQRMGLRGVEGLARVVLMVVEAKEARWDAWEEEFKLSFELLEQTGFVDVDVAHHLEQNGQLALAQGEVERARRALQQAECHWDALEREESAARVADLLLEIDSLE